MQSEIRTKLLSFCLYFFSYCIFFIIASFLLISTEIPPTQRTYPVSSEVGDQILLKNPKTYWSVKGCDKITVLTDKEDQNYINNNQFVNKKPDNCDFNHSCRPDVPFNFSFLSPITKHFNLRYSTLCNDQIWRLGFDNINYLLNNGEETYRWVSRPLHILVGYVIENIIGNSSEKIIGNATANDQILFSNFLLGTKLSSWFSGIVINFALLTLAHLIFIKYLIKTNTKITPLLFLSSAILIFFNPLTKNYLFGSGTMLYVIPTASLCLYVLKTFDFQNTTQLYKFCSILGILMLSYGSFLIVFLLVWVKHFLFNKDSFFQKFKFYFMSLSIFALPNILWISYLNSYSKNGYYNHNADSFGQFIWIVDKLRGKTKSYNPEPGLDFIMHDFLFSPMYYFKNLYDSSYLFIPYLFCFVMIFAITKSLFALHDFDMYTLLFISVCFWAYSGYYAPRFIFNSLAIPSLVYLLLNMNKILYKSWSLTLTTLGLYLLILYQDTYWFY